ncbi:MAG: replication initiation protein [Lachnospiraceae bacterium]|nr:replication initiation protein [Lachnospiraceae bacterium]MEE0918601.1 replication initiation protein [Lachnospiraceae bacterium]
MTNEKDEELYMLNPKEFSKSNILIGSKFKASLTELKITALALSRIKTDGNNVFAEMKASELRNYLSLSRSYFYTALDRTAAKMTGRTIGMSNPDTHEFDYMAVITRATYKKGTFTVKFNPELKEYITNIKSNFTKLSLPILMSFENEYTFRLYEVLKSHEYKGNHISIGLSELRFLLGAVNAELDAVKAILIGTKFPDYDKAFEVSPEKIHEDFRHFHEEIIKPTVDEINEKSDINVTYVLDKCGKGGKVYQITFDVSNKYETESEDIVLNETKIELSDTDKEEIIELLMDDIIEERLKYKDYITIAEKSNYDIEKVKRAYDMMKSSRAKIENVTGWLLRAIEEDYDFVKNKKNSSIKSKNSFNNFQQSTLDIEALEQQLISN